MSLFFWDTDLIIPAQIEFNFDLCLTLFRSGSENYLDGWAEGAIMFRLQR